MAGENIFGAAGSAFSNLVGQVARAGAGIAGMATLASAASSAMDAFGKSLKAGVQVLAVPFKALVSTVKGVVDGIAKSTGGLAAAIGGGIGGGIAGLLTGIIGGVADALKSIIKAFTSLTDATLKLTTGLFELGAAAAPGGMEAFGHVLDYATAVLGKVGIPVFVALNTAVLTVIEHFSGPLNQASQAFAKWIGQYLVSAIDKTIEFLEVDLPNAVSATIDWLKEFGKAVQSAWHEISLLNQSMEMWAEGISRGFHRVNEMIGIDSGGHASGFGGGKGEWLKQILGTNPFEKTPEAIASEQKQAQRSQHAAAVKKNLDDFLADMAASFAKKANVGYSGVADIHKTIQNQAFGGSIQQRALAEQQKSTKILEEIRNAVQKPEAQFGLLGP